MAFSVRARSVAASAVSGWRTSGTQHATSTRGSAGGLMKSSMPDVLTGVDVWFTMGGTLMFIYVREHGHDRFRSGNPRARPGPVRRGGAVGGVRVSGKLLRA